MGKGLGWFIGRLTTKEWPVERADGKVVRSRDLRCAGAGKEIRTEPTLLTCLRISSRIDTRESQVCIYAHEFVFDTYLETLDVGGL